MAKLYTSYYANRELAKSGAVMVAISRGLPRYALPYKIAERLLSLAPEAAIFGIEDEKRFEAAYMRQMDRIGIESVEREIERIRETAGDRDVVLLCFESLTKPGKFCHRTSFAKWWSEKTGEAVQEYGAKASAKTRPASEANPKEYLRASETQTTIFGLL